MEIDTVHCSHQDIINTLEMLIHNITSHIDKGALSPVGKKTIKLN